MANINNANQLEENFDGVELPDELLEGLAGGVISDDTKKLLRKTVLNFKGHGYQLDVVLRMTSVVANKRHAQGDNFNNSEIVDIVRTVWNEK